MGFLLAGAVRNLRPQLCLFHTLLHFGAAEIAIELLRTEDTCFLGGGVIELWSLLALTKSCDQVLLRVALMFGSRVDPLLLVEDRVRGLGEIAQGAKNSCSLLCRRFELYGLLFGTAVKVAGAVFEDAFFRLLHALASLHHAAFVLQLERHRLVFVGVEGRSHHFPVVLGRYDCRKWFVVRNDFLVRHILNLLSLHPTTCTEIHH